MGNKIARTTQVSASEYYLHDLPSSYNLVLMEVLGRGRFFKSILCKHDEGLVLVKVYFKRGDPLDLKEYERRLSEIREVFKNIHHRHLWPFQFWLETDKAAYLLRQYFFSNLHDRISTRPFLSIIEKKWLAFQLLCAVKQSHENGVCHGDIKCENVLVTSWNWLYLGDFASFKPTYIPDDDPSDFSFFFDTGGRRRCYLAPERFYEHGGDMLVQPDAPLKPSMDIFSLGCVIAELFLEGQPLFELSQLLAYRRGQYDPCSFLEKIPDEGIRKMILHMIQLDPQRRLSCENYLQEYGSTIFPNYFSPFLHKFFSCLIPVDPDTRVAVTQGAFQEIHRQIMNNQSNEDIFPEANEFPEQMAEEKNVVLDGLHEVKGVGSTAEFQLINEIASLLKNIEQREYDKVMPENASNNINNVNFTVDGMHLRQQVPNQEIVALYKGYKREGDYLLRRILKNDLKSVLDRVNSQPDTLLSSLFPGTRSALHCEGMVLIASLLCSCLRSVKQPQLRRGAVLLLMSSSLHIDDEDLLQHVIPFVIVMLSDSSAIVRCAALEALCNILTLIKDFPPSDAKIFTEYILPMLSMLPDDPEESVRICYASNIYKIALTAYRFLVCSNSDKQVLSTKSLSSSMETPKRKQITSIDTELSQLRKTIAEIVQELVMGSKNTPNIRRALLQDIGHMCYFFGQRQSNDFLLPILPAFLNDRDEQLRADFFGQIVFVCFFVGQTSVEEYLLPYIEQALVDDMDIVIVNALECLTMLCESRLLRKSILINMIERVFPLLRYPILWVRRAAVSFIAASSASLGPVDSHIYLYPLLCPFLHRKPASLSSETDLLLCLKPAVSKHLFYQALENERGLDMLERQRRIWYNPAYSNQWDTLEHADKNYSSKQHVSDGETYTDSSSQNILPNTVDAAKSRMTESALCNIYRSLDNRDSLSSEKHFTGFMSANISAGKSILHDRPSEGLPVYSFSMEKQSVVGGASHSDALFQWNSIGIASLSTPSLDHVSRSFFSSAVHPKLISGSIYNISNASKKVPLSLQNLESCDNDRSYITSTFQDLSVSDALRSSSAASVDDISSQPDVSALASPVRTPFTTSDAGWKPRGVLVAHLHEHQAAVNDLAISNDNSFFVSASDDSTVKVWDTRKLEKDISFRSRLTYHLDGARALCTTTLNGNTQVVVGASDGQIHLFSVDYISRGGGSIVERYSGIANIKRKQVGEGGVLSLLNCPAGDCSVCYTILYSTEYSGIHLWDTRLDSVAWKFQIPHCEGYVSSLLTGTCGNWFVSGSSKGMLTLWDVRFLLPVNSWQFSRKCPIEKISLFIPSANSAASAMARPLIYVAAGYNEVSLWNAENGSCHQSLGATIRLLKCDLKVTILSGNSLSIYESKVAYNTNLIPHIGEKPHQRVLRAAGCEGDTEVASHVPWALASPSSKTSSKQNLKRNFTPKYRTSELSDPTRPPGVRSLLPLPGGDLLTGGTDLMIRYWDYNSPGCSFCVCGPSIKGVAPDGVYDTKSTFGVQVVQETKRRPSAARLTQKALLSVAASDSAGCHSDTVLSLASVKLNKRFLVSSSRNGAVKVWK